MLLTFWGLVKFGQNQFSVLRIEYPLGGSSKKCSYVYLLLIVAMVLLLWLHIVLLWHQVTMVASEQHLYQIELPRKRATGSIHDYLFCHCPLVGSLFEVLKIRLHVCCFHHINHFGHKQPSHPHQGLPFHFLINIICLKKEKTSREGHWWDISHLHELFSCVVACYNGQTECVNHLEPLSCVYY